MNVLVVKPHLPLPVDQGTRRVTMGLLEDLASFGTVSYLCMLEHPDELVHVDALASRGIEVRAPLMQNRRSRAHRAWYRLKNDTAAVVSGFPRDYFYSTPGILGDELARWTAEERFDVVVLEYWKLARLAPRVAAGRVAVLAHDAEFVKRARQRRVLEASGGGRWRRWRLEREEAREIETLSHCDTILALTERDRCDFLERFGSPYSGRIHVLPVGVRSLPDPRSQRGPKRVGFLGSFKGDFNIDGLRWFLEEVWPIVRRAVPDAELRIAGRDVPDELAAEGGRNGVSFVGFVPDVADFIGECGVFVVPLRFGGGLRIRLIEAFLTGAPVVSTSVGVAGLDLAAGEHYLEADDPTEFAASVVDVIGSPDLRDRLIDTSRRWALSRYAPDVVRAQTMSLFRSLADGRDFAA